MAMATKRNTPPEQRKRRRTLGLRRNHATAIEAIHRKSKGPVKQTVNKPWSTDPEQYDKLMGQLMQEEDDKNDDDFESEKEEESTSEGPTSGGSDNALPGPGFIQLTDTKNRVEEDDVRDAIIRLSVTVEAMEVPEMAACQATARGTFTEEADQHRVFDIDPDSPPVAARS
jgi:hypothetical protein